MRPEFKFRRKNFLYFAEDAPIPKNKGNGFLNFSKNRPKPVIIRK